MVRPINMYRQPMLSRSTSQISSSSGCSGHEKRGIMISPSTEVSTAPNEKLQSVGSKRTKVSESWEYRWWPETHKALRAVRR